MSDDKYDFDVYKDIAPVRDVYVSSNKLALEELTPKVIEKKRASFKVDANGFPLFPDYETGMSEELDAFAKEIKDKPLATQEELNFIKNLRAAESVKDDSCWLNTFSGKKIYPLNPNPEHISIEDIAHSLSHQCRFTGHTRDFYSIAQHCVLVSYVCNHENALYGLLHDASEYILVDIPSPLKRSKEFNFYRDIERKVQAIIYNKFGLYDEEPADVKKADALLLATEARDLLNSIHPDWTMKTEPLPFKIEALGPKEAEKLFLNRFFALNLMSSIK